MQKSVEDNLRYLCLPTTKVHLEKLSGSTALFPGSIKKVIDADSIMNCLKFRYPLKYLGKAYQQIKVPCTTAIEYYHIPLEHQHIIRQSCEQQMFVKVPYQTEIVGYASGKRSAIMIKDGKAYRYKGCGNLEQGFIIQNNQLRGSHYSHTAKREMFITTHLNNVLYNRLSIRSANKSLYYYEIGPQITSFKLTNSLPLIRKYCCVFETVGDRRAGTHLISPLQVFFLTLCGIQSPDWKKLFEERERYSKEDGLHQFIVDFELMVEKGENFLDKYDASPDKKEKYVDLLKFVWEGETTIPNAEDFEEKMTLLGKKFLKDENMRHQLQQKLKGINELAKVIVLICAKVGYEMGRIKRVFCQQGINWGFFNDHDTDWHCNAHLNNFVIALPQKSKPLILPLDFDLAFSKDEFINIDLSSQKYGQNDPDTFQQLLLGQYNTMEYSLAGMDIMTNFTYRIEEEQKKIQNTQEIQLLIKMARTALRDTLIVNFRAGMRNNKSVQNHINKLWDCYIGQVRNVIDVCLMISAQFHT